MSQETRIYQVSQDTGDKFLIEATNASQALRFVTAGMFKVSPAGAKDVARLMDEGVKVEVARDPSEAGEAAARG